MLRRCRVEFIYALWVLVPFWYSTWMSARVQACSKTAQRPIRAQHQVSI
jgi:hypothetical protein